MEAVLIMTCRKKTTLKMKVDAQTVVSKSASKYLGVIISKETQRWKQVNSFYRLMAVLVVTGMVPVDILAKK